MLTKKYKPPSHLSGPHGYTKTQQQNAMLLLFSYTHTHVLDLYEHPSFDGQIPQYEPSP